MLKRQTPKMQDDNEFVFLPKLDNEQTEKNIGVKTNNFNYSVNGVKNNIFEKDFPIKNNLGEALYYVDLLEKNSKYKGAYCLSSNRYFTPNTIEKTSFTVTVEPSTNLESSTNLKKPKISFDQSIESNFILEKKPKIEPKQDVAHDSGEFTTQKIKKSTSLQMEETTKKITKNDKPSEHNKEIKNETKSGITIVTKKNASKVCQNCSDLVIQVHKLHGVKNAFFKGELDKAFTLFEEYLDILSNKTKCFQIDVELDPIADMITDVKEIIVVNSKSKFINGEVFLKIFQYLLKINKLLTFSENIEIFHLIINCLNQNFLEMFKIYLKYNKYTLENILLLLVDLACLGVDYKKISLTKMYAHVIEKNALLLIQKKEKLVIDKVEKFNLIHNSKNLLTLGVFPNLAFLLVSKIMTITGTDGDYYLLFEVIKCNYKRAAKFLFNCDDINIHSYENFAIKLAFEIHNIKILDVLVSSNKYTCKDDNYYLVDRAIDLRYFDLLNIMFKYKKLNHDALEKILWKFILHRSSFGDNNKLPELNPIIKDCVEKAACILKTERKEYDSFVTDCFCKSYSEIMLIACASKCFDVALYILMNSKIIISENTAEIILPLFLNNDRQDIVEYILCNRKIQEKKGENTLSISMCNSIFEKAFKTNNQALVKICLSQDKAYYLNVNNEDFVNACFSHAYKNMMLFVVKNAKLSEEVLELIFMGAIKLKNTILIKVIANMYMVKFSDKFTGFKLLVNRENVTKNNNQPSADSINSIISLPEKLFGDVTYLKMLEFAQKNNIFDLVQLLLMDKEFKILDNEYENLFVWSGKKGYFDIFCDVVDKCKDKNLFLQACEVFCALLSEKDKPSKINLTGKLKVIEKIFSMKILTLNDILTEFWKNKILISYIANKKVLNIILESFPQIKISDLKKITNVFRQVSTKRKSSYEFRIKASVASTMENLIKKYEDERVSFIQLCRILIKNIEKTGWVKDQIRQKSFCENILKLTNLFDKKENFDFIINVIEFVTKALKYGASYKDEILKVLEIPLFFKNVNINENKMIKVAYENRNQAVIEKLLNSNNVKDFLSNEKFLNKKIELFLEGKNCFNENYNEKKFIKSKLEGSNKVIGANLEFRENCKNDNESVHEANILTEYNIQNPFMFSDLFTDIRPFLKDNISSVNIGDVDEKENAKSILSQKK